MATLPTSVPSTLVPSIPTTLPTSVPSTLPTSVVSTLPASSTAALTADVALSTLTRHDHVEQLWKSRVTDANVFMKLFGFVVYLFGKSAALKEDKAAIDFSESAVTLVQTVAKRHLTTAEAAHAGLSPVNYTSDEAQMSALELQRRAEVAQAKFYDAFKARLTKLGVDENSATFGVYSLAAQNLIETNAKSKEILPDLKFPFAIRPIIDTTKKEFNGRIFNDMVNGFASQPLEAITINAIKLKIAQIKGFFTKIDRTEIEFELRAAIRTKHDTTQLTAIRNAFASADPANPKVAEIRAAKKTALEIRKAALETELAAMRGPSGTDGTINAAFVTKNEKEAELNAALGALRAALTTPGSASSALDAAGMIAFVTQFLTTGATTTAAGGVVNVTQIQALALDLGAKQTAFVAAKKVHDDLTARFDVIAQYTGANITGGELAEVNANIDDVALDAAARNEANNVSNFYAELNNVVGDVNRTVRHNALTAIIGPAIPIVLADGTSI